MKKIGIILIFLLTVIMLPRCGNASHKSSEKSSVSSSDTGVAVIGFKEYEHDFGKVTEGEKIGYTFTFRNNGTRDLIISAASTSCGCTVSKYDNKPIPPGKIGDLEVIFDTSGRSGIQTKSIAVKSNASTPVVFLKITAEVITSNNN